MGPLHPARWLPYRACPRLLIRRGKDGHCLPVPVTGLETRYVAKARAVNDGGGCPWGQMLSKQASQ